MSDLLRIVELANELQHLITKNGGENVELVVQLSKQNGEVISQLMRSQKDQRSMFFVSPFKVGAKTCARLDNVTFEWPK